MADRNGSSRTRTAALGAAAIVVTLVTGLGLAEAGLRISGLAPPPALASVTETEFNRIPGIFAPGQRVRQQTGTPFEHLVTIDTLGYRGTDFPRSRPAGELRVLFAGDSFTFGHNVQDHETLPAQLEEILAHRCGAARVINAGLSGSTILGQAHLVQRGLVLNPTLVVLMYHENDIDELAFVRTWEQVARNRELKSAFPASLVYRTARVTALGHLGLHVRLSRQLPAAIERSDRKAEGGARDSARVEYQQRLGALAQMLQDREIELLFVAFPHPSSIYPGPPGSDYSWVLEVAAGLGIPTIDLVPALAGSDATVDQLYLLPHDYHPSPLGHAIAAARLADTIISNCAVMTRDVIR